MIVLLSLGFLAVSQALLDFEIHPTTGQFCLACCGPAPCCNDCGLNLDLLSLVQPVVGTKVDGKEVVSTKRFLTDDLLGSSIDLPSSVCLDCCGPHPCCHDCGLGGIFGAHHTYQPPMTTAEPQSPEKEETYGTDFNSQLGHLIDTGYPSTGHIYPDVDPAIGHVDPILPQIDPVLTHINPDLDPAKPYFETLLGKKK